MVAGGGEGVPVGGGGVRFGDRSARERRSVGGRVGDRSCGG